MFITETNSHNNTQQQQQQHQQNDKRKTKIKQEDHRQDLWTQRIYFGKYFKKTEFFLYFVVISVFCSYWIKKINISLKSNWSKRKNGRRITQQNYFNKEHTQKATSKLKRNSETKQTK